MPRRTVEDSDTGLEVVYEGSHPSVDVVAVHGIGAHRDETWTAPIRQQGGEIKWLNWLSDPTMLPRELPNIRVLNWGYKSDWFGNPVQNSLSSLGDLLWTSLNMQRENCQDRPIIFIAHCFGGLIVMRVLTERSQATIAQATVGIAFLGTPFRGTDKRFHEKLPQMAEANIGGVDDRILHYLEKGNPTTVDLRENFLKMRIRSKDSDMPRVVCFYESLKTQVNKIVNEPEPLSFTVVDNDSAVLDAGKGIDKHAFQRDHFQLNKFKSPTDLDFRLLCQELKSFMDLADKDVRPRLKSVVARRQDSIAHAHVKFQPQSWVERHLTPFDTSGMTSKKLEIPSPKKMSPSTSGISLDCHHVFLRDVRSICVYRVADIQFHLGKKSAPSPVMMFKGEPGSQKILEVNIGRTVCASVTETSCSLHRFFGEVHHEPIRRMSHENTWKLSCVAVLETTLKDDLIIVALGLHQERGGVDYGKVEVHSIWQNDWREHTKILAADLWDPATRMSDSPKTLSFSLDGAILTCTTQRHDQIHSWQLPTAAVVGKIKKICETTRPFNIGVNAKGITSTASWMSQAQHPYVLCTTSPSTERDLDGGEWTFIAPISVPFAAWDTERAYHCLRQVQGDKSKHLHIHAGAISPQGNLIALLDSNGRICLIPLRARTKGGIVSTDHISPIELKPNLDTNEDRMADIRFDPLGTKLYATNWNGRLLIFSFPNAYPATIVPEVHRAPTLASQASFPPPRPDGNQPEPQHVSRGLNRPASASSSNIAPDDSSLSKTSTTRTKTLTFEKPRPNEEVSQDDPKSRKLVNWRWPRKLS